MNAKRFVLVGGGVRCGKSAFALSLARRLGTRPAFVATAEARDEEMRARIDAHRAARDASCVTIEEPIELPRALERASGIDVVVVDCLTLWLSNLLCHGLRAVEIEERVDALVCAIDARRVHVVAVTNEVGMGLVPETALGRAFRDWSGVLHQRLGQVADEIYLGALGAIVRLKPAPVRLVAPDTLPAARAKKPHPARRAS